jgi:hypothetical protein
MLYYKLKSLKYNKPNSNNKSIVVFKLYIYIIYILLII